MTDPTFPSIVHGTYSSDDKVVGSVTLTITNLTTGDTGEVVTDERGQYVFDAANFDNGYTIGDVVEVTVKNSRPIYGDNIDVSNGDIRLK